MQEVKKELKEKERTVKRKGGRKRNVNYVLQ
jgi:hypothetical protein